MYLKETESGIPTRPEYRELSTVESRSSYHIRDQHLLLRAFSPLKLKMGLSLFCLSLQEKVDASQTPAGVRLLSPLDRAISCACHPFSLVHLAWTAGSWGTDSSHHPAARMN